MRSRILARRLLIVVPALVALSSVSLGAGCAAGSDDAADHAGADLSAAPAASSSSASAAAAAPTTPAQDLTDEQLAAELAVPPAHPSAADLAKLVGDTIRPVATTARLKLLNAFIAAGQKQVDPNNPDAPYETLAGQMEGIFWATPRDLTSAPAGFGGQTFATSVALDDGSVGPTKLTVHGVASADYKLDLTVAAVHVTVAKIPKGSTAAATAKLIAKAINASNKAILDSVGQDKTFDVIGGDHAGSQSGVDDVEVSASGAAVVILVALNG